MHCRSDSARRLRSAICAVTYQTAFDDGYMSRVMPYVWRFIWTVGGLMALIAGLTAWLPTGTGTPALDALVLFSAWYPIGVMLLVFASWPYGLLIRARTQERRK